MRKPVVDKNGLTREDRKRKAYLAGYDARLNNLGKDTCPFDGRKSYLRLAWIAGWQRSDYIQNPRLSNIANRMKSITKESNVKIILVNERR